MEPTEQDQWNEWTKPPSRAPESAKTLQIRNDVLEELGNGTKAVEIAEKIAAKYSINKTNASRHISKTRLLLEEKFEESATKLAPIISQMYIDLYERQWEEGDLKGAKATLDSFVKLMGIAAPERHEIASAFRFDFGGGFNIIQQDNDITDVDYEEANNDVS